MATRGSQGDSEKKTTRASTGSRGGRAGAKKSTAKPAAKKTAAKKPAAKKKATSSATSKAKSSTAPKAEKVEVQEAVAVTETAEESSAPAEETSLQEEQMSENTETVPVKIDDRPEAALTVAPEEETPAEVTSMVADKMIAFHLGGQRYAVPLGVVQEIQQIVAFSEIPAAGGAVVGMVNLRGSVIPAIDMRYLIGLAAEEYTLETPMIICRAHGQLVALVVDEVEDVLSMPEGCMHPPPAMHNLSSKLIGVCRMDTDLVYLLDVESLVAPMEIPGR